ncbi:ROK family protein [Streptomyces bathyalis]|uniref:ROK family protein n=1 Tax=Streptomyces bathyalis TaxID=2710756 RepID=A0A7T1T2I4_9ACTN|nr:ROK family protein [Streptomyces bathyalis]QPP05211.1 ROK family protein [Streptomyces bathyalis]
MVQRIFTTAGHALGGAVANVAEIINPQRVILGGEGTRLGPPLLDPFREALQRVLVRPVDQAIDLRIVHTHDDTWAHGAACQFLTDLFRGPTAHPGGL